MFLNPNENQISVVPSQPKKYRLIFFIVLAVIIVYGLGIYFLYHWTLTSFQPASLLNNNIVRNIIVQKTGQNGLNMFDLIPDIIGMNRPMTYLVIFQNNTEIRPGGGFIGVYGVIRVDKGAWQTIKLEGTEILDRQAPKEWVVKPPAPIANYLGVDRWYFRDSNWSPDFPTDGEKILEFFKAENGAEANNIDAVIAITPTVAEEMMQLTGPIEVEGIEFTADNIVERLEYEVEYGFAEKNIDFADRKQIIRPLFEKMASKIMLSFFVDSDKYINEIEKLIREKHILAYSPEAEWQNKFVDFGLTGGMNTSMDSDFVMWVDANLGALKTDNAVQKELSYELTERADGRLVVTTTMRYTHNGEFDWRTTRYRTYARLYAPLGSELLNTAGAMKTDRSKEEGKIDQGMELNHQWYGGFIFIEPGEVGELSFSYLLPKAISDQVRRGEYKMYAQKQLGSIDNGLTLNLNFDKNITVAMPAEEAKNWGDKEYVYTGDLREDKEFLINL